MKRTIGTVAMILLVMLSLAACGKKKSGEGSSQNGEAAQGAGVSAATNVTLPADGETVAYVLAARMVSDYMGSEAFLPETGAGTGTFWTTADYLVSAYGSQNTKISVSEDGQSYEVKLEQLRYYAAALYADLGKAKKLPELSEMITGVTRKSKKVYTFSRVDTSQYRISIDSLTEAEGGYKANASLVDVTSGQSVAQYAAAIKKSAYTGKKSPFHYAVASLSRMTKMPMVQILVGTNKDESQTGQDVGADQTQDPGQGVPGDQTVPSGDGMGTPDGTQGTTAPTAQDSGSSVSDGGTSPAGGGAPTGSSSSTTGDPATGSPTGTDGGSSSADNNAGEGSSSNQGTTQPSGSSGAGGGISNGSALTQARDYFGTSDEESGKAYVYSYEGTTTFNGTDYYNFYVTDGESYVTNILVSYDGSRILKGTKNADGSWSLQ